jgi:hypothetical protein
LQRLREFCKIGKFFLSKEISVLVEKIVYESAATSANGKRCTPFYKKSYDKKNNFNFSAYYSTAFYSQNKETINWITYNSITIEMQILILN